MKRTLLALAAASAVLLSTPALAEVSPFARAWIAGTAQEIGNEVRATPGAAPVAVRATVGGDRRFNGVQLVGASGSRVQDEAVLRRVRMHRIAVPPTELRGRTVTLLIAPPGNYAQAGSAPAAR
jgi:hypothetical protein